MGKLLIAALVCCAFVLQLFSQKRALISPQDAAQLRLYEDTIALLAYAVVNDSVGERRFAACHRLIPTLVKALKASHSFDYKFERLQTISIQYPADSSFRIFTWQLYVDKDEYRYYGAIQMNTPELKLYPLLDRSSAVTDVEQEQLSSEKWYGAVYYNLMEVQHKKEKYYLLFGFDGYRFFHKRKVVDVLQFKEGKPLFGAPVFVQQEKGRPERTKNRLMLEYSAATSVKFNYDEALGMIVFDHLIPMQGQHGEGMVMVPDGSYEAYQLEAGRWKHIQMLETQALDEAPRPNPILDQRDKNIFGKKGN